MIDFNKALAAQRIAEALDKTEAVPDGAVVVVIVGVPDGADSADLFYTHNCKSDEGADFLIEELLKARKGN